MCGGHCRRRQPPADACAGAALPSHSLVLVVYEPLAPSFVSLIPSARVSATQRRFHPGVAPAKHTHIGTYSSIKSIKMTKSRQSFFFIIKETHNDKL